MATATAGRSRRGCWDESEEQPAEQAEREIAKSRRPDERFVNTCLVIRAYVVTAMNLVGSLALLWATVVLLGGFVTALTKKDFWYLTSIAFIQAAGLFSKGTNAHYNFFLKSLVWSTLKLMKNCHNIAFNLFRANKLPPASLVMKSFLFAWASNIGLSLNVLINCGAIVCFRLSLVRLREQDYGIDDHDATKANLKPALNLFYLLSLAQSATFISNYILGVIFSFYIDEVFIKYHGLQQEVITEYVHETYIKCMDNPANITISNWNLVTYCGGLLDSESPEDCVLGVRAINTLIKQEIPITRQLIRWPGHRIQKLIGALGWSSPDDRETRELATRIVAHLASDLILSQFPGALECISTLLDTSKSPDNSDLRIPTMPKRRRRRRNGSQQPTDMERFSRAYYQIHVRLFSGYLNLNESEWKGTGDDLILQGLVIIENLARSQHNCRLIYGAKALLSKITAPLRSDNLTEDIEVNEAWPKVVDASLRVVRRLMADPGDTGRDMRREIANKSGAVQNLVAILHLKGDSSVILNLQKQAIGVLGHLFSDDSAVSLTDQRDASIDISDDSAVRLRDQRDASIDISDDSAVRLRDQRDASIDSMVHLFLTDKWVHDYLQDREPKINQETKKLLSEKPQSIAEIFSPSVLERNIKKRSEALMKQEKETASQLRIEAGKALAMLSVGSRSNCEVIIRTRTGSGDVIHCLTEMMDSTTVSIGCRINAAVVLRHLCTHRTLDDGSTKRNILQKVVQQLFQINRDTGAQADGIARELSRPDDLERQVSAGAQPHEPTLTKPKERSLHAALLSLYRCLRETWDNQADFANVVAQMVAGNDFARKLKAIVEENSYATPACLAMLKIACQTVILMVQHNHHLGQIREEKIIDCLSKATETMVKLESYMLFSGEDHDCHGIPVRPLFSDLVKQAQELLM